MHVRQSGIRRRDARRRGGPVLRSAGVLLALLLAGTVAGCGDGGSESSTASPSPPATATATTTVTATETATETATGTASPSPGATAPADPATATTEITNNWQKFFDPTTPIPEKASLLQNGDVLLPVLEGFSQDPRVGQVKAAVTKVEFTSATEATVTYELSLEGSVVAPAASGQAVLDNGIWKVSRSTLCGLLVQAAGAGGTPIPGCG
ncbi:hypothetical protein GCM10009639_51460 [Kitasatospora putterlickiae]|uniref:Low molecular weight antigen MTB12-like C-terminal domain-containing protein n=1 Tax=Kitasatospora putterlickiae TaxID=221725 RepID=A0ABN1YCY8_9ACTN